VLRSDWLTQGPRIPALESAVAEACGAAHAIAMNSATSALHVACLALGLGPGDCLWTTPITFVASANCALYCGAEVDFVDIDPRTYNMSVDRLGEKLEQAEAAGRLPKIVVPVHLTGQSCEMEAIGTLAKRYGFSVIEDASHAIGARYKDRPVGDCRFSDICVFSFHPVKIVTTAEGGVATTEDPELAAKMDRLRSHGITRDPALMTKPSDGGWYYQQIELGLNYRMTDLHAALGVSQMNRLSSYVSRRHEIVERYGELLDGLPVTQPWQHPDTYSAFHLYVARLPGDGTSRVRDAVFAHMREEEIGVNLHYIPVNTQPYYRERDLGAPSYAEADAYYREAISLPLFPTLTDEQQTRVVDVLAAGLARVG
jgi:UDP-4-amino-4,6-dideoxy-N-acetyl-beta-L-altrosamine transaminase